MLLTTLLHKNQKQDQSLMDMFAVESVWWYDDDPLKSNCLIMCFNFCVNYFYNIQHETTYLCSFKWTRICINVLCNIYYLYLCFSNVFFPPSLDLAKLEKCMTFSSHNNLLLHNNFPQKWIIQSFQQIYINKVMNHRIIWGYVTGGGALSCSKHRRTRSQRITNTRHTGGGGARAL